MATATRGRKAANTQAVKPSAKSPNYQLIPRPRVTLILTQKPSAKASMLDMMDAERLSSSNSEGEDDEDEDDEDDEDEVAIEEEEEEEGENVEHAVGLKRKRDTSSSSGLDEEEEEEVSHLPTPGKNKRRKQRNATGVFIVWWIIVSSSLTPRTNSINRSAARYRDYLHHVNSICSRVPKKEKSAKHEKPNFEAQE